MKVLITGGAGFIGYHLAKHLANQNYDVTTLDNFIRGEKDKEYAKLIMRDNVRSINGDITLPETFEKLDNDYDQIYHLAAINGTENFYKIPDKVLKVGVLGIINILDWFIKCTKGKLLFTSSSETYAGALKLLGDEFPVPTPEDVPLVVNDPKNVRWSYGAGKIIGEVALHAYSKAFDLKNFSIIRYHNIYGPRMGFEHVIPQFIERIIKQENPFKIFGGQETRTFCYIDDGVRATQLIMENEKANGETYHVGRDDDEIKIMDLANKLFNIAEVSPSIEINPAPKGCVMRRCPDITKLKALGYSPQIDLEQGLKDCYEWYKKKY